MGVIFGKGSIVEKENKIKAPFTGVAGGWGVAEMVREPVAPCGGAGLI